MDATCSEEVTTALITKLPPEILSCIFKYFCSHCCNEYKWPFGPPPGCTEAQDTSSLWQICLVSQSFRNVAQEILFHSFNPGYLRRSSRNPHWNQRLEPFLRTVAARPDLARSVKAVFLSQPLYEALDFWRSRKAFQDCVRALGKSPDKLFRKLHKESPSPVKEVFFQSRLSPVALNILLDAIPRPAFEEYFPELFSVLVAILPNLGHLAISQNTACRSSPIFRDVLPDMLDRLGVQCVPIKTIETHAPPKNLLRRCTRLETCITDGWHAFPDMPTVKHLHLRHTPRYPRVNYSKCISACSGSLLTLSCVNVTESLYKAIDIPRLHDSLEVLHLEAKYFAPLPSLTKFYKLKHLFLDTHGIYGIIPVYASPLYTQSVAKILPRNIANLSVSSCFHTRNRWEQDLCETLASKDDFLPALESITSNEAILSKDLEELFDTLGLEWVYQEQTRYDKNSSYSRRQDTE